LYEDNCFITLTYSDENLPAVGSLVPDHLQLFMKRLRDFSTRSRGRSLRFYACGEYGDQFGRPHYHGLLFDFDFSDKYFWKTTEGGQRLYRSPRLEKLWPLGDSYIGAVTFDSAAYVARYCVKKITGEMSAEHYHRIDPDGRSHWLVPEFGRMSQSLGKPWLEKFHTDVYNSDFVLMNGHKMLPPKAYDRWMEINYPTDLQRVQRDRQHKFFVDRASRLLESTYDRYSLKEEISSSRLAVHSPRSL